MSEGIASVQPADARASRPSRRRAATLLVVVVAAIAVVGVVSACWSLFGPAAGLPGTPLTLVTETAPADACPMARLGDVVMERNGSELVFHQGDGEVEIVWPYGMAARLVDGKAELFAPNGIRIGVEGQTLPDFAGGYLTGNAFHVCGINGLPV